MKIIKRVLIIIGFAIMIIFISGKVYAIKPVKVYNPVNVTISNILKAVPLFLMVAYILGIIIYSVVSKKDKKHKVKILLIWLFVVLIIGVTSYLCAEPVLREGMSYSSSQDDFRNYKRNLKNEKYTN